MRERVCMRLGPDERALLKRLSAELGEDGLTDLCRDAALVVAAVVLEVPAPRVRFTRERRRRRALLERIKRALAGAVQDLDDGRRVSLKAVSDGGPLR